VAITIVNNNNNNNNKVLYTAYCVNEAFFVFQVTKAIEFVQNYDDQ